MIKCVFSVFLDNGSLGVYGQDLQALVVIAL